MIHITCRLTAKNWDHLRNPTLGNRVWATFTFYLWIELFLLFSSVNSMGHIQLENEDDSSTIRLCQKWNEHLHAAGDTGSWILFLPLLTFSKNNQHETCFSRTQYFSYAFSAYAFTVLTLFFGARKSIRPACKKSAMRCWCGFLSGARCRLFAYGPADATAIPKPRHLLPHFNADCFYLSDTGLPMFSWQRGR